MDTQLQIQTNNSTHPRGISLFRPQRGARPCPYHLARPIATGQFGFVSHGAGAGPAGQGSVVGGCGVGLGTGDARCCVSTERTDGSSTRIWLCFTGHLLSPARHFAIRASHPCLLLLQTSNIELHTSFRWLCFARALPPLPFHTPHSAFRVSRASGTDLASFRRIGGRFRRAGPGAPDSNGGLTGHDKCLQGCMVQDLRLAGSQVSRHTTRPG